MGARTRARRGQDTPRNNQAEVQAEPDTKTPLEDRLGELQAEMTLALGVIAEREAVLRALHETRLRIDGAMTVLKELIDPPTETPDKKPAP